MSPARTKGARCETNAGSYVCHCGFPGTELKDGVYDNIDECADDTTLYGESGVPEILYGD